MGEAEGNDLLWKNDSSSVEIRFQGRLEDGRPALDEIVATCAAIHLEQMDHDRWWMGIEAGGRQFHLNFSLDDQRATEPGMYFPGFRGTGRIREGGQETKGDAKPMGHRARGGVHQRRRQAGEGGMVNPSSNRILTDPKPSKPNFRLVLLAP